MKLIPIVERRHVWHPVPVAGGGRDLLLDAPGELRADEPHVGFGRDAAEHARGHL